ncbi:hypothetical protein KKD20_06020, partial [Patescibacteria group bacterium]|nr:hypothetical protein [Patescibacteria group bacterium]
TKNCGGEKRCGESEGGQKFLPPNPLPFCPPEHSVSVLPREARQSVGILFKKGSSFVQQLRPKNIHQLTDVFLKLKKPSLNKRRQ